MTKIATTKTTEGAVLVVTFAPGLTDVLVGLSKKEQVVKFHGGQILSETPEECAKRELRGEAGLKEGSYRLCKMPYERPLRSGAVQYTYCALLHKKEPLPSQIMEEDEMGLPFYACIVDVLNGYVDGKKVNPWHRIALVETLLGINGWETKPEGFADLLYDLYQKGIIGSDINGGLKKYADNLRQAIRERRI